MAWKTLIGFGAVLVVAASSALAFQEQKAGSIPEAAPLQEHGAPAGSSAAGAEFATPAQPKDEGGTEVRIPGLGTLGVLPKMDFGLELLYGANEGKTDVSPADPQDTAPVDLMIRGSVKHNF